MVITVLSRSLDRIYSFVNAKTKSGTTPLHSAVREGHKEVEDLLTKHGGHE